jgi:hypothetical protein
VDDDAFRWEGDDEPPIEPDAPDGAKVVAQTPGTAPALPDGYTAVGRGSETVGRIGADGTVTAPDAPAPLGNAALIGIGVLAGIYLLYAIGWIVGGSRLQVWVVSDAMFYASWWLAILSPVIWFGTVYVLTARSRLWLRFVWLIAGAVLLIPWPFLSVGPVPA